MRFNKWIVLSLFVIILPWSAQADTITDSGTVIEQSTSGSGTTDPDSGVQFDPNDNKIGDPDAPSDLTSGTTDQITFLAGGGDPLSIAFNLINVALSFLGIISMILLIYAGWKWFTARDNEEEAKEAKDIIVGAVVGLAITLGALGIAQLLFNVVAEQSTVQTSWTNFLVQPAYAAGEEEEQVPSATIVVQDYKPEELPFDPFSGSDSENVAVYDGTLPSILNLDLGKADPLTIVFAIINTTLTLLGLAFMLLMLYAGFTWVLAQGNEESITKAKETLKRAVIGLVIILAAYGTSWFVFYIISAFTYGESFTG